jgi:hypothetical protein
VQENKDRELRSPSSASRDSGKSKADYAQDVNDDIDRDSSFEEEV